MLMHGFCGVLAHVVLPRANGSAPSSCSTKVSGGFWGNTRSVDKNGFRELRKMYGDKFVEGPSEGGFILFELATDAPSLAEAQSMGRDLAREIGNLFDVPTLVY